MHAQVRIKTMQRQRGGMDEVRAAVRRDVLSMQHTPAWSCVKDRKAKAEREDGPEILQQRADQAVRSCDCSHRTMALWHPHCCPVSCLVTPARAPGRKPMPGDSLFSVFFCFLCLLAWKSWSSCPETGGAMAIKQEVLLHWRARCKPWTQMLESSHSISDVSSSWSYSDLVIFSKDR